MIFLWHISDLCLRMVPYSLVKRSSIVQGDALVNINNIYSGIFTCTDRPSDFRNSLFVGRALELLRSRVQEMEDEDPLQFTRIMRN
jgi:hypothetical protein